MTREQGNGERRHALVAGGRTGGHVFPGLALADELVDRGWTVSFVGLAGGIEDRAATARGLPFHSLPAGPVVGASALGKVRSLATVARASAAGRRLVRRERADVVVGLGGYVSVPAVVGARLAGRPILLFEPNASAGVANRWLSRLADEAALAHPDAAGTLRCPTRLTGTPVRPEFFAQPTAEAVAARGEDPRLLVVGGSQGANQINELVPAAVAGLEEPIERLRIVHQCGASHVEATREAYRAIEPRLGSLEVTPFLENMATAMGGASLIVSRAGAITLAEICAVGRASVLVPLEIAGAHQVDNAEALARAGAAELLPGGADAAELGSLLRSILWRPERLAAMSAAAGALGRPDAVGALADRVEALTGRKGAVSA